MPYYARASYVGDGSTAIFSVPFEYMVQENVTATVDGTPVSITWPTTATIQILPAPAASTAVVIQRTTPIDTPIHDFSDGANLTEEQLDLAFFQNLLVNQELRDEFSDLAALVASYHP